MFGEAGSQRQQTVFIADPDGERCDSYFSAEFHAVKIDGNGVKRKFPTGSFFERKTEAGRETEDKFSIALPCAVIVED